MKRAVRLFSLLAPLLVGPAAHAQGLTRAAAGPFDARALGPDAPPDLVRAARAEAARAGGIVASIDDKRGVPSFLWAAAAPPAPLSAATTPEAAARRHLARFARAYGLSRAALDTAKVTLVHDIGRGGILVALRQRVGGIEVFRSDVKVLMHWDQRLIAISGSLHPAAVPDAKPGARAFTIPPQQAVAAALKDRYGLAIPAAALLERPLSKEGGYRHYDLAPTPAASSATLDFVEPARVKRVFFPHGERLVPAYYIEIFAGETTEVDADAYAVVLAADDGRLLYREELTAQDAFDYRVWAETTGNGRPLDAPTADYTPHPTGVPDGSDPAFIPPVLISMEGFNTSPLQAADPWLPANAAETVGNNVDAYADHYAPDGYSNGDLRATTTSAGAFDRVYDTALAPLASVDQTMAAVTQLFYVTNWLHDWYYDSGFVEAAGNAQRSNFGRGGLGGDPLRAEAQDGVYDGFRNNANMSTPADGVSPRMQMYTWTGADIVRTLDVQPLGQSLQTGPAAFSPSDFNITGDLILVDDGVDPVTNGCEPPVNDLTGKVVLIDRGDCTFKLKAVTAESAGAIGVIIATQIPGAPPPVMGGNNPTTPVTIPVLSVTYEDGDALKAALLSGPVTVTMERAAGVERDSSIDNMVIAHEWGHYLHHRLSACSSATCSALSEGWAEFTSLHLAVREGDDLDGAYALGAYAAKAWGDSSYFGLRRAPYSVDPTKNGFTFRHIAEGEPMPTTFPLIVSGNSNAEAHNAGEIWADMLFDAYVALLKQSQAPGAPYTFDEARRLMSDIVVAGLELVPNDATYTETRDALLAAALAHSPDDMLLLAGGFAGRGAGSCAISPDRYSQDFTGVVEGFALQPRIEIVSTALDDASVSCDKDGVLDGEETGRLTVQIRNAGMAPLIAAQASVFSPTPGVLFPAGPTATFPDLPPFATATAEIQVGLDASFMDIEDIVLAVDVTNPGACEPSVGQAVLARVNLDDVPIASADDDVESDTPAWSTTGDDAGAVWSRIEVTAQDHQWHGLALGVSSDTALVSPALAVSPTQPFKISFDHAYQFESSSSPAEYFDGAVIEISADDGATWTDISDYADPGYDGVITGATGNALHDRPAYVGTSAAWPALATTEIDLGTQLAGKIVRVRFRIATDPAAGTLGWRLDNFRFPGIVNTPFSAVRADGSLCPASPLADAGPDQTVEGGADVTLDASASVDPNGDPLTFAWAQTAGPPVVLAGADSAIATFRAPGLPEDTTLTFEVAVSDGAASSSDTVDILVTPRATAAAPAPPAEDGCGCGVVGADPAVPRSLALAAIALLALARRRRRGLE